MIATFFTRSGHLATVQVVSQSTVTADWYTNTCLPQVVEKFQEKRPKIGCRGIQFHHDNAPAYKAGITVSFLESNGLNLLGHPPYSPDLAPCDFFLFPKVKKEMRGQRFDSGDAAVDHYLHLVNSLDKSDWQDCFKQWFQRMNKCIDANGHYFDKF